MIEVIANGDVWNGKRVRLIGFLHLQFEYDALWLGKSDFEVGLTRNGLWIDTADSKISTDGFAKCAGGYALVEGTFRAGPSGHMGLWSGEITQIVRCIKWPPLNSAPHRRPKAGAGKTDR